MSRAYLLLIAARCAVVLSLASLGGLFVSAGQVVDSGAGLDLHGTAAVALHVTTGLLAVLLALRAAVAPSGVWAAVAAVVLFGLTFLQAAMGGPQTVDIHVAGSLAAVVLCTWLCAWTFARRGPTPAAAEPSPSRVEQETTAS